MRPVFEKDGSKGGTNSVWVSPFVLELMDGLDLPVH